MIFERRSYFHTLRDGQTTVNIPIYENTSIERAIAPNQGQLLFSKDISWGYPVPAGTSIVATVKRGSDGIVHIEVECQEKKVFFEIKPENSLSQYEISKLKNELDNMQF